MKKSKPLIEHFDVAFQWAEQSTEEGKPKKFVAEGTLLQTGVPTLNKRRYGRPVMETALTQFKDALVSTGQAFSLDGHPEALAAPKPSNINGMLTDVWMKEDAVQGRFVVFNTAVGRDAQEIIKGGGRLGVSLRGSGSLSEPDKEGIQDVGEDFRLLGFDMVLNPASQSAGITSYSVEHKERREEPMTLAELKKEHPDLVKQLQDEMEQELLKQFNQVKEEVAAEIGEQLRQDFEEEINALVDEDGADDGAGDDNDEAVAELEAKVEELETRIAGMEKEKTTLASERDALKAESIKLQVSAYVTEALKDNPHKEVIAKKVGTPASLEEAKILVEKEVAFIAELGVQKPAKGVKVPAGGSAGIEADDELDRTLRLAGVQVKS